MTKDQYDKVFNALKDRKTWEDKQLNWYNVRHTGIRRGFRPYSGAPDMHFPLADTLIEKLKGFYVQLLYATQTIASFVSKKLGQDAQLTSDVGAWFDYQLKQNSNFERETMIAIDQTLQNAKSPIKVRWDSDAKQLRFDAIDPLYLIVPPNTQELKDADWLIHVIQMSEDEYRANPNYKQDDDYIASIKGKGRQELSGEQIKQQYKELREGIGYSDNEYTIIVWECYLRDRVAKKIMVETISPLLGWDADPIRAPFQMPYSKGSFSSGERYPFGVIRTEIKDKGWYSERGIPEIVFQEEQLLNKTWNTECTWMDFFGQPQYKMTKPVANPSNFRSRPGAVVPDGLDQIPPPELPNIVENLKGFARALAEYRVSMPDFGTDDHLGPGARPQGKQTATWVNAVTGLTGVTNDVRSRVFRLDLCDILNLAWSILLQYASDQLDYIAQDSLTSLDPSALHDQYEIQPSGSADSWNKGAQMQKAAQRWQMLNGNPYIKQDELVKTVLELDDPKIIQRLFQDPGLAQQDQAEQQAIECMLMTFGWPAQVHPSDDDFTHVMTEGQFVERKIMTGEQISPELARLLLQHGGAHDQQMAQKKDKRLSMVRQQAKPIIALLQQIAGSDQQQPGNVVPGPGAAPTSPPPNAAASGAPPKQDPQKNAATLMNAFAALRKSGVNITDDQVNAALQEAGMPPIQPQQSIAPAVLPPAAIAQ